MGGDKSTEEERENNRNIELNCRSEWYKSEKDAIDRHADWEECMKEHTRPHEEWPPMMAGDDPKEGKT